MLSEDKIQAECIKWANNTYKELRVCGITHIPNGGTRHKIEAMKLKAIGVRAGFPDLMIIPDWPKPVFFIEMKTEMGITSKDQKLIHDELIRKGYEVFVINSIEKFKELINEKMKCL